MREHFTKWIAGYPQEPIITSLEGGVQLVLDPKVDKGLETILYYHGAYELGTLDLISKCLNPGDTFLDVGANIGLFSIFLAKNCPEITVCAFEPLESTYAILKQNIELNQCDNIHTFPFALGIDESTEKIVENLDMSRGSASMVDASQSGLAQHEVSVKTLNSFMEQEHFDKIGVVKIDVEGWEQNVLLGATALLRKKEAPIWVIEHNSTQKTQGATPTEVFQYMLTSNDYNAFKSLKGKQVISPLVPVKGIADLPENDNIFYLLKSHLDRLPKSMFSMSN